jgi:glycine betaine/proline transport system permease protein
MADQTDVNLVSPNEVEDPWGKQAEGTTKNGDNTAVNAWDSSDPTLQNSDQEWLSSSEPVERSFSLFDPFAHTSIPLDQWTEIGLAWLVTNFRPAFQAIRIPIDTILSTIEGGLLGASPLLLIIVFSLLAWQLTTVKLAAGTFGAFLFIGLIGVWAEAMVTLALVLTAVFFSLLIGLPIGIWLARSNRASAALRPVLDAMQTTPAFVYLVPIVMLFGIGNVPGVVVTIIFALPPLIRLTNLGIRQVPADLIEASRSFGASSNQLLLKVQLPLAMPTIMAGVNQTLMLCLSMVVIASMIAVGGLGQMVLRGIGRLDMGLATVGGIGIVLLAIVLDRITQAMGEKKRAKDLRHWYQAGPVGLVRRILLKKS